ncbi:MAG: hypothetical protein ACK4FK_14620 [Ferrovibrio sp.]|uniref:hypothetical protein n=1 Tax=Ferrovibrio sp. TaxID=1917215 RepID=UPI00391C9F10
MPKEMHQEAVELLLASISQQDASGLRSSFLFGKPGAPLWERRFGAEIFFHQSRIIRAALFVRRNGPAYLKYLPIGDISSALRSFITENYGYIADEVFFTRFSTDYAQKVSAAAKSRLANAIASSPVFCPTNRISLFPLIPVRVAESFNSEPFFLVAPEYLDQTMSRDNIDVRAIRADSFPPLSDWKGQRSLPNAWLGVRSPLLQVSRKMRAAILGALALAPLPGYRYLFSGRDMFGGNFVISDEGSEVSFGLPHTPPLMHDIVIEATDHAWLGVIANKLTTNERVVRRQLRALEYFYRAWELDPPERFPILCMTLDAVFGDANHATQAVIDGVREMLGTHVRDARLRQLMDLRASVIHGGAPDVYDSRKYARYFDEYEADPIHDLELVVAHCLRLQIFGDDFREQVDPNAEAIKEAQGKGYMPKVSLKNTILDAV